jgi:hypothetical protein
MLSVGMARQTLVLARILLLSAVCAAQKDNGAECDCFKTNGSTEAYFSYHRFFDYRNVPYSLTSTPKVLTNPSDTSGAGNSSAFFSNSSWTADWTAQNWDNSDSLNISGSDATILMINSPNNVYIGMTPSTFPLKYSNKVIFPSKNPVSTIAPHTIPISLYEQRGPRVSSRQLKSTAQRSTIATSPRAS